MKKIIAIVSVFIIGFASFSQSADAFQDEDAIMLPDVSTVIQGGAPKAGKSAVPDYSQVLPKRQTSELVPRLPDASTQNSSVLDSVNAGETKVKSIYAEGLAGLGYPNYFIGKFSVYNQTGPNPFRIDFGHESLNGYGQANLTSGFFDKDTLVSAEKTFSFKNGKYVVKGLYNDLNDGLQNKSTDLTDVSKDLMQLENDIFLSLSKYFGFHSDVDGSWYVRHGNILGYTNPVSEYIKQTGIVDVMPSFGFDFSSDNFFANFDAGYNLYADATNAFGTNMFSHRGEFTLDGGYENDFLKVLGKVGCVVGTNIGENSVLVPFTVAADFKIPVSFSLRPVKISVEGGLDSYAPKIDSLEMENKYTAFDRLPAETSDWYGKLNFSFPIVEMFTFNLAGDFRKTAFGNGTWVPAYDDVTYFDDGLYRYQQKDMLQINTKMNLSLKTKYGTFGGEWKSYWADRKANVYAQFVQLTYSFQSKTSFFTADAAVGLSPVSEDLTPVVDFDVSLKVSPAVRLAFTGTDIVKLLSGSFRVYAGSGDYVYYSRSGYAGIVAKFVF